MTKQRLSHAVRLIPTHKTRFHSSNPSKRNKQTYIRASPSRSIDTQWEKSGLDYNDHSKAMFDKNNLAYSNLAFGKTIKLGIIVYKVAYKLAYW